jgi:hypothetical protein
VAAKRQLVLIQPDADDGSLIPLGSIGQVTEALADYNVAPDGSARVNSAMAVLYGPGLVIEMPTGAESLTQLLVTLIEEDNAWPVLMRLCRGLGWNMMDPESGRTFGPSA